MGLFHLLAILLLMCAALPASAKTHLAIGDILKQTETYYQQIQAFSAVFHQVTTSAAASAVAKTEASGRLYYQKPRQMRWEYDKPELQAFVANRDVAWLYVPGEKQISLFDANRFFSSPLARAFFDGIVELKVRFTVTLDALQSTNAAAVLKLIPKEEDPNIKTLYLWIDLKTYRIQTLESHDMLGNINRIVLDSQQASPQLDPKLFQLDVPPSTAVVDIDGRELPPAEVEKLKLKIK
jgi:outer membrane lipoprotein carrier protein